MGKKLQKIYLKYYSLLIAHNLWQSQYQILSIIFLKEFIEINVNLNSMMKNVKFVEVNISIATFFQHRNFKDELNVLFVTRIAK